VRHRARQVPDTVVEDPLGGDTVSATATLPHPDRLATRERPPATAAADLELAVEHLASLVAGPDGDLLDGLEAVARAATRLARPRRHRLHLEEEAPAPMAGTWSLEHGMLPQVVLGEN
jgi:hypothetical protein